MSPKMLYIHHHRLYYFRPKLNQQWHDYLNTTLLPRLSLSISSTSFKWANSLAKWGLIEPLFILLSKLDAQLPPRIKTSDTMSKICTTPDTLLDTRIIVPDFDPRRLCEFVINASKLCTVSYMRLDMCINVWTSRPPSQQFVINVSARSNDKKLSHGRSESPLPEEKRTDISKLRALSGSGGHTSHSPAAYFHDNLQAGLHINFVESRYDCSQVEAVAERCASPLVTPSTVAA